MTDDHLTRQAGGSYVKVGAAAVRMDLSQTLCTVRRAGVVAREVHLVVVRVDDAVVATAGHGSLTLRHQQAALQGVVVVDALVVGLPVVDVVHHRRHADGETRAVVVVVGGRGHQPSLVDHGG